MRLATPSSIKNLDIATPALPAPLITIFASFIGRSTNFKAFINAAPTAIAVPC